MGRWVMWGKKQTSETASKVNGSDPAVNRIRQMGNSKDESGTRPKWTGSLLGLLER